jgi:hypothetical protein
VSRSTLTGFINPQQVVSASGKVWVVGYVGPAGQCAVDEVDPVTLATRLFSAPECLPDVAVSDGDLYLATLTFVRGTAANQQVRLARFDTATGRLTVLRPVVTTLIGSAVAHTAMAYGNGSVWLYAPGNSGSGITEVVQISTATGAVLRTITGVPDIGGIQPAVAANHGGLWLGGGGGGPPNLERLPLGAHTLSQPYSAPSPGSILWLSAIGDKVWADVETYTSSDQGRVTVTRERLVAFDTSGKAVVMSRSAQVDYAPIVGSGRQLWSVGIGARCANPQRLWRIDPANGSSVVVTTLTSPADPCSAEASAAVLGRAVFVLDPTDETTPASVLYRIQQ